MKIRIPGKSSAVILTRVRLPKGATLADLRSGRMELAFPPQQCGCGATLVKVAPLKYACPREPKWRRLATSLLRRFGSKRELYQHACLVIEMGEENIGELGSA